MIVISDTSAISALIQIGRLDLLRQLFQEVVLPPEVWNELMALSEFGIDLSTLHTSLWLQRETPQASPLLTLLQGLLDKGEAQALALAVDMKADLLIIDEQKGRKIASSLGLVFTGIGGIFIRAKKAGLIDSVQSMLDLIEHKAGFYLSATARDVILRAAGE